MKYWWVNQGRTYAHEIPGGYMWAPKLDKTGHHRVSYDSMLLIQPGDVIFSHFRGAIRAVGIAMGIAESSSRPDFQFSNQYWDEDGWQVDVEFEYLANEFDPKTMLAEYRELGPVMYGPISGVGKVNMEYLYAIPENLGALYRRAMMVDVGEIETEGLAERKLESTEDVNDRVVAEIRARRDIGPTEIRALTLSRRGQGFFRKEVERVEPGCRLTGVTERRHLRASHIKPWRASNDTERLSGANGLLLSPHVDHLFDQGFISFRKNGDILRSSTLRDEVIDQWSLDVVQNAGSFTTRQDSFMAFHRDVIFQRQS